MDRIQKYLEVLELPAGASWDEISRAYRELIKVWHPDRFLNEEKLRERAEHKSRLLNEAIMHLRKHYRRTQSFKRSDIDQALHANRSGVQQSAVWRHRAWPSAADLRAHTRLRKTESQTIYDNLAERTTKVKRLTQLATTAVVILSIAIVCSFGYPALKNFKWARQLNLPPSIPEEGYSDYRVIALAPPENVVKETSPKTSWLPEERPALIEAAANCKLSSLQALLNKGTNLNITDKNGDSALAWAARRNCIQGAKLLIEAGAKKKTVASNGFSPRDWASWARNEKILELLDNSS